MIPAPSENRWDLWFTRLGDMGVWAGAYLGGCMILAGMVVPLHRIEGMSLLGGFLLTVSAYLAHRVGWRPRIQGESQSDIGRFEFLRLYARIMRGLAAGTAVGAGVCLGMVQPWLILLVPGAHLGIWLYGGWRTGGRRMKDRLGVKNLAVAGSMVAFSFVVLFLGADEVREGWDASSSALAGGFLLVQVFADAMLCDLDDLESDRILGSRTIPVVLGSGCTWTIALALKMLALGGMVVYRGQEGMNYYPVVAALLVLGTVGLWLLNPRSVRDWVDIWLPVAAGVGWLMILIAR